MLPDLSSSETIKDIKLEEENEKDYKERQAEEKVTVKAGSRNKIYKSKIGEKGSVLLAAHFCSDAKNSIKQFESLKIA